MQSEGVHTCYWVCELWHSVPIPVLASTNVIFNAGRVKPCGVKELEQAIIMPRNPQIPVLSA